ncbi:aminodeoxychorismate/anthranilate synthase component II [Candidatus Peregrinibacteria bacterium]|nr:aminodeoxychorismate/anthranilate synthase component II [Candidatus Peregrinibacteria bacterium]
MKIVIIDHYDSFTYLLAQYFGALGGNPVVVQHDQTSLAAIRRLKPTHLVLSPGPGTVEKKKDFAIGFQVIEEFYGRVPLLGVCLGHQGIYRYFGGKIAPAPVVMHGKRSLIHHMGERIFKGLPNPFEAMRYHSLIATMGRKTPPDLDITAWTDNGLIMAIQHRVYPVFGVQFHPESIGTPFGKIIFQNFLNAR